MIANRFARLIAAHVVTLVLLPATVSALGPTRTFELRIFPYCKPGTFCGNYNSFEELEAQLFKVVEEVNLQWAHTGISFFPNVQPVDGTSPSVIVRHCDDGVESEKLDEDELAMCTTSADCPAGYTCKDLPQGSRYWMVGDGCIKDPIGGPLRRHWAANVNATIDDAIAIFVVEGAASNWCCGGGRGVFCNPKSGSIWSHEIAHRFCGSHTFQGTIFDENDVEVGYQFRFPDPPEYPTGIVHHDGDGLADTPPDPGNLEKLARLCTTFGTLDGDEKCEDDADCTAAYGASSVCNYCNDRVCSQDNAIACSIDETCEDKNAGTCICNPHMDQNADGTTREGHVWCNTTAKSDVDTGSPHATRCEIDCKQKSGGTETPFPAPWAMPELVLSYYSEKCRGPYVFMGDRHDMFTEDGEQKIFDCIEEKHADLVDVCTNSDADHDGICDADDTCMNVANLSTQDLDTDGDDVPDGCDNCFLVANPDQADNENDGNGDVCDSDDDNDQCIDAFDQHPTSSLARAGSWIFSPTCSGDLDGTYWESEAATGDDTADPDNDAIANCRDLDDDNDGLCDDDETLAGGPGVPFGGCVGPDPCPLCDEMAPGCFAECHPFQDCPIAPLWDVCAFGSGCLELFLKLVKVVNPDPTTDVRFERFDIVGGQIFAGAIAGLTASESAAAFKKLAAGAGAGALVRAEDVDDAERIALEIWRRATATEPERFVARVGEYAAGRITLGPVGRGNVVRILPATDRDLGTDSVYVDNDYILGLDPGTRLADADADTWPDFLDNCPVAANPEQFDDDRDGFGNRCDADLDNDCRVSQADVDRVRGCIGADMTLEHDLGSDPDPEDEEPHHIAPPLTVENVMHETCRVADLDEDEMVDEADADLVRALVGTAMEARCTAGAFEPVEFPGCIRSHALTDVRLRIRNLKRTAGRQRLQMTAQAVLEEHLDPPLDPQANGVHVLVRTSQGRTLLDVAVPPGAGWSRGPTTKSAVYENEAGLEGLTAIALNWGLRRPPGAVNIEIEGRGAAFQVDAAELPLFAEIVLDDLRAATEQCAETEFDSFAGGPSCTTRHAGNRIACR